MKDAPEWIQGEPTEPGFYFLASSDQGGYETARLYKLGTVFIGKYEKFVSDPFSEKSIRDQYKKWLSINAKNVWFCLDDHTSFRDNGFCEGKSFPWNVSHYMKVEIPKLPKQEDR
jgi:hypothetical protein